MVPSSHIFHLDHTLSRQAWFTRVIGHRHQRIFHRQQIFLADGCSNKFSSTIWAPSTPSWDIRSILSILERCGSVLSIIRDKFPPPSQAGPFIKKSILWKLLQTNSRFSMVSDPNAFIRDRPITTSFIFYSDRIHGTFRRFIGPTDNVNSTSNLAFLFVSMFIPSSWTAM